MEGIKNIALLLIKIFPKILNVLRSFSYIFTNFPDN